MIGLSDLVSAATLQQQYSKEVDTLEQLLKEKQEQLRRQAQEIVPSMMDEIGITTFVLSDGYTISIQDKVQAKIPEKFFGEALQWLKDNDFDGIVKSKVLLDFGKGEDSRMQEVVEHLYNMGLIPQIKQDIHHMTLKAFVREQLEQGTTMPLEKFGAYVIRESVITNPKMTAGKTA